MNKLTVKVTKQARTWMADTFGPYRRTFSPTDMEIAFVAGWAQGLRHGSGEMGKALEPDNAAE